MRIISTIRWILVAAFAILLVAPTAWSLATGQEFVQVTGESMTPTYQVGDVILISKPTTADFTEDTVVTVRNDDGDLYTHRIVSITGDEAQLKGDGNAFEDPSTITADDIVGVVRGHLGGIVGQMFLLLTTWPARISLLVLLLGLFFAPLSPASEAESDHTDDDQDSDADAGHNPTRRELRAGRRPLALTATPLTAEEESAAAQWMREQSLREEFFASFDNPATDDDDTTTTTRSDAAFPVADSRRARRNR